MQNVYSHNDLILKTLLKLTKLNALPCGLQEVDSKYQKKITNKDFTDIIKGHTRYVENMEEIMYQLDFENDLN